MKTSVPNLGRCRGLAVNRTDTNRVHERQAIRALRKQSVSILSMRNNGRRLVLVIDQPPAFVRGVMRSRHTSPIGNREYTMAAPYRGVQLEWRVVEDESAEVRHG
jgi:hypothetical protein